MSSGRDVIRFGRSRQEVREVAYDYLDNAVAQGTFTPWLEQNAKAINGMSVVLGRGRSCLEHPERVYTVLKLPPEPRTFRVVIGWRDHRRGGGKNNNWLRLKDVLLLGAALWSYGETVAQRQPIAG